MPMYDYVCETCGNRFEEWQKMTDEPIMLCPTCGGPVHRVISPVGLVFKGNGFYKTDNRAAPPAESSAEIALAGGTATSTGAGDGKVAAAKGDDAGVGTAKSGETTPTGAAAKGE